MEGIVAKLLRGPDRNGQGASRRSLSASAPIILFALIAAAAGVSAAAALSPVSVLSPLAVAAATTVICLCVGLPMSLSRLRLPWQLPLWLLLCAAPAAWARAATPVRGPMVEAVIGAATLLPVMVLCLRGWLAAIPATTAQSAACAGAGCVARLLHVWLPLAWPAALRASVIVFLLALAQPLLADPWAAAVQPGAQ